MVMSSPPSSKCGERKGIEPFSPVPKTGILPLDQRSSRKLPSEIESLHPPYQGGASTNRESKKVHGENRTLIYGAENRCANPLHHADLTPSVDVIEKEAVAESSSSQESNLDSDPRKVMCFPLHYRSKKKKRLSIVAIVE